MDTQSQRPIQIHLGCLLPTRFDVKLTCQKDSLEMKWSIRDEERVEESVRRQLDAACKAWAGRTCGKVQVDDELVVTREPIRAIKKSRVEESCVAELIGRELYHSKTCFMVWVPLPDCIFSALEQAALRIEGDCMWIPTTETRQLHDLQHIEPSCAARHELKHWVKNRMEEIGVHTIPSPDKDKKKQYWPKLREALTAQNIANVNNKISERMARRR